MADTSVQTVCVFSGSSPGTKENFCQQATLLGTKLAKTGLSLVYGGGNVGLMGACATAVVRTQRDRLSEGASLGKDVKKVTVTGVIPKAMVPKEVSGDMGDLEPEKAAGTEGSSIVSQVVVDSMHDRKVRMYSLADAFIALPGGFGTLEELFEVITWAQLGIHGRPKPIGILNTEGYFSPLLEMVKNGVESGFIKREFGENVLVVESDPGALVDAICAHRAPDASLPLDWKEEEK
jgi:uncharacterized protein (TIGR00730 family)